MSKIIADACSNHLGDRRLIEEMIKQAAEVKIDIIKFQSFKADNLNKNYPNYSEMYNYYKSVELSRDDHVFIIQKCEEYGIEPLFTALDLDSAQLLSRLKLEKVKIASPDATNKPLIDFCLCFFEEIIISTGMMTDSEFARFTKYINTPILYCISKYPTPIEEVDFEKMVLFDGFSDHTEGIKASLKAIDLGMSYIERHYTLGKYLPGKDHKLSSTPDEFKKLVEHRDYIEKCKQYKIRFNGFNGGLV